MQTVQNNREIYIRFLQVTQIIEDDYRSQKVDFTSVKLLEFLAVASEREQPLSVSEAMTAEWIASPSTLHRKIQILIESGFISPDFYGNNRRKRYLIPTEKANTLFSKMGKFMKFCLSEN